MKRNFPELFLIIMIFPLLYFTLLNNPVNQNEVIIPSYPNAVDLQNRLAWENYRLMDPVTGRIPENIRSLELEFARSLPSDKNYSYRMSQWVNRGPYNVGGRTRGVALDINDENVIIAGGVSGGMWRSENGGTDWVKTTAPGQLHSVTCLKQDLRTGKNDIWYFGTGEGYGSSASATGAYYLGDGLFKSTDNGMTWTSVISTSVENPQSFISGWQVVWNVALDQAVDTLDVVYAAIYGTIMRSDNGGDTWTNTIGGSGSYFTDVTTTSDGIVYATLSSDGTKRGIWRSVDGILWTNITPTGFPTAYDRIVMGLNPMNENSLYFLGVTPGGGQQTVTWQGDTVYNSLWKYTYLSGNGADTNGVWTDLSASIPNSGITNFDNFYAQGSYDLAVKVKPDDSSTVFIAGTNIYRSTDGFSTPNNVTQIGGYAQGTSMPNFQVYTNHHPDVHDIFFLPSDPDVLFTASDGGLHKTINCLNPVVSWQSLNHGYYTTQLYTVNFNPEDTSDILIGGFQDNGNYFVNSSDQMADWVMTLNGDGSHSAIAENGLVYYQSIQLGKIYKMAIDAAGAVSGFKRIDPIGAGDYLFINQFAVDPNNPDLMYLPVGRHIWRNDSLTHIALTNTYDSISDGWFKITDSANYSTAKMSAVAISKIPANIVYAGTSNRKVYKIIDAHTGDPALTDISSTSFPGGANVGCVAIDPRDADKVLVVFTNYNIYSLFYSSDGGLTWVKAAGNLEQGSAGGGNGPSFRWAEIMPVGNETLYLVATSTGLYGTNEINGTSTIWVQVGANTIGNVVCESVRTREADGLIVVGTHGNGIYTTKITSINEIVNIPENQKTVFPEFSIFPNPVSDQLIIRNIADSSIELYDVNGKLIYKSYITENEYLLNVNKYKSGVYYLKFKKSNQLITKPIIINH
ncbi:MAG: T9SS type A sorting domain-containing protein [Bacteroidota bacterium]